MVALEQMLGSNHTWIRHLELRPGNRRVLHHANTSVVIPKPGRTVDWERLRREGEKRGDDSYTSRQIHVGVPGRFSFDSPPGSAVLLPQGSRLRVDLHYVPSGKPETDRTSIGLHFASGAIDKERRNLHFQTKEIVIPPNTPSHAVGGMLPVPGPITVYQLACHMHLRGKSYRIVAELPDGNQLVLMNVPRYNFNWQQMYVLAKPVQLPAGTKVHYMATYDNSRNNQFLAGYDTPDHEVTWGERTIDEMMGGHVLYTLDTEHLDMVVDGKTGAALNGARLAAGR